MTQLDHYKNAAKEYNRLKRDVESRNEEIEEMLEKLEYLWSTLSIEEKREANDANLRIG
jgi:hypothetical protein